MGLQRRRYRCLSGSLGAENDPGKRPGTARLLPRSQSVHARAGFRATPPHPVSHGADNPRSGTICGGASMSVATAEPQLPNRYARPREMRSNVTRNACWIVALTAGAAQAWAARFRNDHDGVSYLDVANAYLRHDWHNAVNTYWSPLYSWSLELFLKLQRPSPYWELPTVHLVNFLIYALALVAFHFLLSTFVADRRRRDRSAAELGEV